MMPSVMRRSNQPPCMAFKLKLKKPDSKYDRQFQGEERSTLHLTLMTDDCFSECSVRRIWVTLWVTSLRHGARCLQDVKVKVLSMSSPQLNWSCVWLVRLLSTANVPLANQEGGRSQETDDIQSTKSMSIISLHTDDPPHCTLHTENSRQ